MHDTVPTAAQRWIRLTTMTSTDIITETIKAEEITPRLLLFAHQRLKNAIRLLRKVTKPCTLLDAAARQVWAPYRAAGFNKNTSRSVGPNSRRVVGGNYFLRQARTRVRDK